jgi:hypothetical protein
MKYSHHVWMLGEVEPRLVAFCRQISETKCCPNDDVSTRRVTFQQNKNEVDEVGIVEIFFAKVLKEKTILRANLWGKFLRKYEGSVAERSKALV